jgi:hypothetical protein
MERISSGKGVLEYVKDEVQDGPMGFQAGQSSIDMGRTVPIS